MIEEKNTVLSQVTDTVSKNSTSWFAEFSPFTFEVRQEESSVFDLIGSGALPAGYASFLNLQPQSASSSLPKANLTPSTLSATLESTDSSESSLSLLSLLFRSFSLAGTVFATLLLILLCIIWILEKGPSPALTQSFCRSVRETSAIRWVSNIFLSQEELAAIISRSTEEETTSTINTSLIHFREADAEAHVEQPYLELVDISWGNCKGKLLIVRDPKSVILGTSGEFGSDKEGLLLTDMVAKYNGIAGINAGGFNDESGKGNGGIPQGIVIEDGELIWTFDNSLYNIIGLDYNGILHVGTMTGKQALSDGIRWGVSFTTHDGVASSLIINGVVQTWNLGGGVNPRTAIGQREDGSLLLLVLDGRSINTLGATMENICDIMLEYGAVNAGNLDGGSSSVMVYGNEIINHCASVTGPRQIPTGFIVLPEGEVR